MLEFGLIGPDRANRTSGKARSRGARRPAAYDSRKPAQAKPVCFGAGLRMVRRAASSVQEVAQRVLGRHGAPRLGLDLLQAVTFHSGGIGRRLSFDASSLIGAGRIGVRGPCLVIHQDQAAGQAARL